MLQYSWGKFLVNISSFSHSLLQEVIVEPHKNITWVHVAIERKLKLLCFLLYTVLISKNITKFLCVAVMQIWEHILNLWSVSVPHNPHVIGEDAMSEFLPQSSGEIAVMMLPF